jgi:retron-type reverse transcriptase
MSRSRPLRKGLIKKSDIEITALNDVVLKLTKIARTEKWLQFLKTSRVCISC